MIGALDLLARIAAERMVNSVVAGIALTMLTWSLLRLLPGLNARTRVAVWLSVLATIPGLSIAAVFVGDNSGLASHAARIVLPEGWAFSIFVAWVFFASLALLRVGFGLWRIRGLRKGCTPIDLEVLDAEVRSTIREFCPERRVGLFTSETARVPMAVGFVRPAVILPRWILTELSAQEISAILIHEFAHVRRWDDWTNFFQKLVRAVFFFHPSVWWLDRRLALEREIACDDAVLAATDRAHDYARCLVDLAEKSLLRRSLAMAQAAVQQVQQISLRISKILDPSRPRATRVSRVALAGVTGLAAICLVAVLQSPTLIAFQNNVAATSASSVPRTDVPDNDSAMVVPATMRAPVSATRSHKTGKTYQAAHSKARLAPQDVVPAKFAAPAQQTKVLRAELTVRQQTALGVEDIVFVMPDARFNASGQVVWTWSVWRVTVFHPVQAPAEGTIPNAI